MAGSGVSEDPTVPSTDPKASKNQLKNEAKRKEKMAKFFAKQEKLAQAASNNLNEKKQSRKHSSTSHATTSIPILEFKDGEFKDVSKYELLSSYHPKFVEKNWYSWWEAKGFFKPEIILERNPSAPIYVIPMPPPNVTGSLHLGHAMATSIQDALIRWKRMTGHGSLYIPGCDHAGISCQVVVEKYLKKTRDITRHDLGRLAFVGEVWKWKDAYGDQIYKQLKRLGGSMDWSRARFTLDQSMSDAVVEAFVKLFDEGIIYRANRLVNWSSALQTAVSDLEVDHREISGPIRLPAFGHNPKKTYEFGYIYSFAMKVIDSETDSPTDEEIIVSTTRPETIPGDVAVIVNPNDSRYTHLHGKFVQHPIHKTKIPIICDSYADISFGTGAVKITPAHDLNDFEVSLRHNLPLVIIFDQNNRLNDNAGPKFHGLMRFDAREAIIEYLEEVGLFRGRKEHSLVLPICNRSGDIIEPRVLPQWWMKCQDIAEKAVNVVRTQQLEILPEEAKKIWYNWLENCRDWCLSRQLWWGHRIPAYSVQTFDTKTETFVHLKWIAARSENEALEKAAKEFPLENELKVEQDPDVLDTWFSSALWPFATLGWPNSSSEDLNRFYPASVLETGRDIIFFWVARMVMMGIHLTGKIPFKTVYLHSIVRDAHGRKMSKSLGNVIDPIDVIEGISLEDLHSHLEQGNLDPAEISKAKISQKKDFPKGIEECGSDALRFALLAYTSQGSDINLDIQRVIGYRRFCNKIWNFARFVLNTVSDEERSSTFIPSFLIDAVDSSTPVESSSFSLFDKWIIHKLSIAISDTNSALSDFNFMKACSVIHSFILYDICDVYLESIKPVFSSSDPEETGRVVSILFLLLDQSLKMLHPFMPFITEELWQKLNSVIKKTDHAESISISKYPAFVECQAVFGENLHNAINDVAIIQEIVHSTRSLANDMTHSKSLAVSFQSLDSSIDSLLKENAASISSLIKGIKSLSFNDTLPEECSGQKDIRSTTISVTNHLSSSTIKISIANASVNG